METEIQRWIEALASHDRIGRLHAAHQLCLLASREAVVDELIRTLRHGAEEVRAMAAFTMGRLAVPDERVVAALIEALDDPCNKVQRRAIISLGELGAAAAPAVPALQEQVRHWPRPLCELAEHARAKIQSSPRRAA